MSPLHNDQCRVVFLDPGTGKGGASRSLFYTVEALNRQRYRPLVVLAKTNPLAAQYLAAEIEILPVDEIPRFRPGERKNALAFAHYLYRLRRFHSLAKQIKLHVGEQKSLLHCNHENLAFTGLLLSWVLGAPWVCHVRTTLVPSRSARFCYRLIERRADHIFFISEPCLSHFSSLTGNLGRSRRTVVYNSFAPIAASRSGNADRGSFDRSSTKFTVVTLANFTPNRGVERAIEVAHHLNSMGRHDFRFLLCGEAQASPLSGRDRHAYVRHLRALIEEYRLQHMVEMPGHLDPEIVLPIADTLFKPSPEKVPWGRDIIEAMSYGVPIVSIGSYSGFVETGRNGFLDADYSPEGIARHLIRLKDEPGLRQRIGQANTEKAASLFSPRANTAKIEAIYDVILGSAHAKA